MTVKKGIAVERRTDLVGGGLIRSAGGWSVVKAFRRSEQRVKSDERLPGDGDFVECILKEAREDLERRYSFKAAGYDFDLLVSRVAQSLQIEPADVVGPGKYVRTVKAHSVLKCA